MNSEAETTNQSPNPAFLIGSEYLLSLQVAECRMFLIGGKMTLARKSSEFFILERNGCLFQIHILLLSRWNKPNKPIKRWGT